MARLIDANLFEKNIRKYADKKCFNGEVELANGILKLLSVLKEQPTAEPQRVKGEWKNKNDYPHCTICDFMPMFDPHLDDIYYSPFCPNCGADMRGETNA